MNMAFQKQGITAFENRDYDWILSCETQFIEIVDDDGSILDIAEREKF